jgi:hypothetical protein
MSHQYINAVETAKLVRQALKEAFPGIKFSVRSKHSLNVRWTDGPNEEQVKAVVNCFRGGYFNGMHDYAGSMYAMFDGVETRFGCNYLFYTRDYSDALTQRAIDAVYRRLEGCFIDAGIEKPTVYDFNHGHYYCTQLPTLHSNGNQSVQCEIHATLHKMSDRLKVNESKTAARVTSVRSDGYVESIEMAQAERQAASTVAATLLAIVSHPSSAIH